MRTLLLDGDFFDTGQRSGVFKIHLPDFDVEILRKDFTIDDSEWEALANNTYDVVHEFVSLYD
jgi:hypothetical protein